MKFIIFFLLSCANLFAFEISGMNISKNDIVEFKINDGNFSKSKLYTLTKNNLFDCSPKLVGIYEYTSNNLITFYPQTSLIKGKEYTCTYEKKSFGFSTQNFEVDTFKKLNNQTVEVNFNDSVVLEDLKKNTRIYKIEKLAKNDILFDVKKYPIKNLF